MHLFYLVLEGPKPASFKYVMLVQIFMVFKVHVWKLIFAATL